MTRRMLQSTPAPTRPGEALPGTILKLSIALLFFYNYSLVIYEFIRKIWINSYVFDIKDDGLTVNLKDEGIFYGLWVPDHLGYNLCVACVGIMIIVPFSRDLLRWWLSPCESPFSVSLSTIKGALGTLAGSIEREASPSLEYTSNNSKLSAPSDSSKRYQKGGDSQFSTRSQTNGLAMTTYLIYFLSVGVSFNTLLYSISNKRSPEATDRLIVCILLVQCFSCCSIAVLYILQLQDSHSARGESEQWRGLVERLNRDVQQLQKESDINVARLGRMGEIPGAAQEKPDH